MFQISFIVRAKTAENEKILLVGDIPQLGCWDTGKGLRLAFDGQEWSTSQSIQIEQGKKFQFKLIKLHEDGGIEWESLPNNSNRKHKPQHHSLIILKWSQAFGKVKNKSISSFSIKGYPGVMIRDKRETTRIKKKSFNPDIEAKKEESEHSSDDEDPYGSVVSRKGTSSIRSSISMGDIEEIYYDTTPVEAMFNNFRKTKIYLVSQKWEEQSIFLNNLQEQLETLIGESEFLFKWLIHENGQKPIKTRRVSVKLLPTPKIESQVKWKVQDNFDQNSFFIFVDLHAALNTKFNKRGQSCLYLPSACYLKVQQNLEKLEGFRFICFDSAEANRLLYNFFKNKKVSESEESDRQIANSSLYERQIEKVSLQNIIEELKFSHFPSKLINTVHTFSKQEVLETIIQENSILFIDSSLMKHDYQYFKQLITEKQQKRFIIVYHPYDVINSDLESLFKKKSICIILKNFQNFYYLGKEYKPLKKHKQVLELLEMKAKFLAELQGGECQFCQNQLVYKVKNEVTVEKIAKQLQSIIKDQKYFKITVKNLRVRITWNIAHRIRLIRTLCRMKQLQSGPTGNFFLLTHEIPFQELKQELKLFISLPPSFLLNENKTKVKDFSYGNKVNAKYSIKMIN